MTFVLEYTAGLAEPAVCPTLRGWDLLLGWLKQMTPVLRGFDYLPQDSQQIR